MPRPRRSYSPEYRVEAAHLVIDSGRPVREVARELDVHENLLHKRVREERRRMTAAGRAGTRRGDPGGGGTEPLSVDDRAELARLRAKVAEQATDLAAREKDLAFLEKVSAYFAAQHPK
ncbi:transposase [Nocardia pseudovaccinii]|uniref:transposase n=1 Tax=Nocardia pseudovaccinii TaxID=189540 RepID=UPI003D8AED50